MIKKGHGNVLISVVMPVYNGEKYLKESIESILNQSYKNFEFIIIDDASTDDSLKIIKKYAKKDKRIKLLQNKTNLKEPKSRNRGFAIARGKYISIMDADDISLSNRFELQLRAFKNDKNLSVCGGAIDIIDDQGFIIGKRSYPKTTEEIKRTLSIRSPFANPSVMFKKLILKKVGFYDETFFSSNDYDFWFRVINKGYRTKNLEKPLIKYRIHKQQSKYTVLKDELKNTIKIQFKNLLYRKKYLFLATVVIIAESILLLFPAGIIHSLFIKFNVKSK